jgi:hypothetical protein
MKMPHIKKNNLKTKIKATTLRIKDHPQVHTTKVFFFYSYIQQKIHNLNSPIGTTPKKQKKNKEPHFTITSEKSIT